MSKPKPTKDLALAAELMRELAQATENKREFLARHSEEMKAYETRIKECTAQLVEIGERNRSSFDVNGHLEFEEGYLHIATNTVVEKGRKFDATVFAEQLPDLIDVTLKTAGVKKMWLDKEGCKTLRSLGVTLDTETKVQVKLREKS